MKPGYRFKTAMFILFLNIFGCVTIVNAQGPGPAAIIDSSFLAVIGMFLFPLSCIFIPLLCLLCIRFLQKQNEEIVIMKKAPVYPENETGEYVCPEIEVLHTESEERRLQLRDYTPKTIIVRKKLASGKFRTMKFKNRDISRGGAFIITRNLSFFNPGDELDVVVADVRSDDRKNRKKKYYAGKAVVVHSEAIFDKGTVRTESGFGMKFISGK